MMNQTEELNVQLESLTSPQDFCKDWAAKWKPIAQTVQGIIQAIYKPGGVVLGFLIQIADTFCGTSAGKGA